MCQNPSAAAPIIEVRNWPADSAGKSTITGFATIAVTGYCLATLKSTNACLSPLPSRIRQRMQHRKKFCFAVEKSTTEYAVCNLWGLLEASRNYNYRIMLLGLKITSPKYKMPSYYILYLYIILLILIKNLNLLHFLQCWGF
jgi:hypothetical protein